MNGRLGVVTGFVAGVGVGGAGAYLLYRASGPPISQSPATTLRHEALKWGMPTTEDVRVHEGFVTAFDFRTRNPRWVLEHVTAETLAGPADRSKSSFHEDAGIDQWLRSRLQDYKDSGYDRGHLAPAADFKGSQKAMNETFVLSNISPQVGPGFNRDYWARFEHFLRGVAKKSQDVRIVTGPLWMPTVDADGKWVMQHPMIGEPPSLVSVPTHFYKVVAATGLRDGQTGVAAFVMPNAPIAPKTPLTAFVVPLEALEAVAGTRFFPGLLSPARRRALDDAAHGWRSLGLQQMTPFERRTHLLQSNALPAPQLLLPASRDATRQAREAVRQGGGAPPPLAGSAGAQPGSAQHAAPLAAISQEAAPPLVAPKTAGGHGVAHLCELSACTLPAERFWELPASLINTSGGSHQQGGQRGRGRGAHGGKGAR